MECKGLTQEEVKKRTLNNLVNHDEVVKTKSIKNIIFTNIFTLFNFLNFFLGICVILVGSYKNTLFLMVVVLNTVISIIQEINAKKTIDKLSLISSFKIKAIRDNKEKIIGINDIVMDDILLFENGNQIVVDCTILDGEIEVNEAFITGEEDPIYKKAGDTILSGSFVTSGKCLSKVIHIGNDNYTSKISNEAKYIKAVNSEIKKSFDKILKIISFVIIPFGIILFFKQLNIYDHKIVISTVKTVAALIGMIPEGLILLTSTVMAVSVIRLAKYDVLVQQMYSIETLARVDTICLDKTGTLTEGKMELIDVIPINKEKTEIDQILNAICYYSQDDNATIKALKNQYNKKTNWIEKKNIPFSSKTKYSGSIFEKYGEFKIGAYEFLKTNNIDISKYEEQYRTLVLVNKEEVLAIILLQDKIRKEAKDTLQYFQKQNINIKIISGDNPKTVANIANRLELYNLKYIDMSKNKEEIKEIVLKYDIFGRVTPEIKKQLIIALKELGQTVAMTGDGVNDVLALKEADLSIAMASGSEAARNVSQIILLNSNFASLPKILKEGRRTINNIQRSASLFLTKTIYSFLLVLMFLFVTYPYPFIPIQLTLTSMFTIGIPSFILALEPNNDLVKGNFLVNVISNSIPAALTIVINVIIIMILTSLFHISYDVSSTLAVIMIGATGFILIYKICYPFNLLRTILCLFLLTGFITCVVGFKHFLSLVNIHFFMFLTIILLIFISSIIFSILTELTKKFINKHLKYVV